MPAGYAFPEITTGWIWVITEDLVMHFVKERASGKTYRPADHLPCRHHWSPKG